MARKDTFGHTIDIQNGELIEHQPAVAQPARIEAGAWRGSDGPDLH